MTFRRMEMVRNMRNALFMLLQKAMPGRFKAMHYYNAGAIFDALMVIFKPMMSKKMQDRVRLTIKVSIVISISYHIFFAQINKIS